MKGGFYIAYILLSLFVASINFSPWATKPWKQGFYEMHESVKELFSNSSVIQDLSTDYFTFVQRVPILTIYPLPQSVPETPQILLDPPAFEQETFTLVYEFPPVNDPIKEDIIHLIDDIVEEYVNEVIDNYTEIYVGENITDQIINPVVDEAIEEIVEWIVNKTTTCDVTIENDPISQVDIEPEICSPWILPKPKSNILWMDSCRSHSATFDTCKSYLEEKWKENPVHCFTNFPNENLKNWQEKNEIGTPCLNNLTDEKYIQWFCEDDIQWIYFQVIKENSNSIKWMNDKLVIS